MNYDIIISHHRESSFRERNLKEILRYYSTRIPSTTKIIIVEQNTSTDLPSIPNLIHIKEKYDTEYFWKSKLVNRGIKESNKEAFCIVDSDAIISEKALSYINEMKLESLSLIFPYNQIKMMNEAETRKWIKKGTIPKNINKYYQKFDVCYTGFFMVISKKNYELIGGFDECYLGWGGEDDAVVIKTMRMSKIDKIPFESLVLHTFHPRKDDSTYMNSNRYKTNEYYTQALKIMSNTEIELYCNGKLDIDKYIKEKSIGKDSLTERIYLKNEKYFDIPITGVHSMPDENGKYNIENLFDGLFVFLGKEQFIINTKRILDASDDEEEIEFYQKQINRVINHLYD